MAATEEIPFAEELKALRGRYGLTQAQLAELLGYKTDHVGKLERGTRMPSKPTRKRYRSLVRRLEAAQAGRDAQGDEEQGSGPPEPGDDGRGEETLSHGGDLPPLPEPPEPAGLDEDGDDGLVQLASGGRKVTVRNLNHFQRIELSLLTFLVGKEIEYLSPASGGKTQTMTIHQLGLADLLPPADGAVIRENGPELAHAWTEWAKTSPRVNTLLSFLIVEGGAKGVAVATGKTLLRIAQNHGFDPISFLMAPVRDAHLASFGAPPAHSPEEPFYVEPHPADDLSERLNGDAPLDERPRPGGGIGFGNVEGGTGL